MILRKEAARGNLRPALRRLKERESWRRFALPTLFGTVLGMLLYSGGFKWASAGAASSLGTSIPVFSIPIAWWLLGVERQYAIFVRHNLAQRLIL